MFQKKEWKKKENNLNINRENYHKLYMLLCVVDLKQNIMAESNIKWKVKQLKKDGLTIEQIQDFAKEQMLKNNRADTVRFWQNVHNNVYIHYT